MSDKVAGVLFWGAIMGWVAYLNLSDVSKLSTVDIISCTDDAGVSTLFLSHKIEKCKTELNNRISEGEIDPIKIQKYRALKNMTMIEIERWI